MAKRSSTVPSKQSQAAEDRNNYLTSFDLKAELLFEALLENGVDDSNIVIKNNGVFFRNFRKDKINISNDNINEEIVNFELSRDGFYDILPESIFHNYRNRNTSTDPVEEFKNRKREEKEGRHFFSPLENEFFRFKHLIQWFESDFFSKLNSDKIADIIRIILAVDNRIPDKLVVKLFYNLLKQNQNQDQSVETIVGILENILQEKVNFDYTYIKLDNLHDTNSNSDDLVLGVTTTLQSSEKIYLKKYNFTIGPLKESENLKYFFENQTMDLFIKTFFNLFLPLHIQFSFNVFLKEQDEKFVFDEANYKSRLGISTLI